ncbi:MAG: DUF167 domain-containing protein [Erythrobacter sp.]|uniref:DUF167 domain-containing protein n=1 Tax=Erythrobacter sp. TaxID=1042 RepID=UPI0025FB4EB3|nr:DUF167 domain-containing protein [Erythrobacter sp.]MCM0000018.1 DUF167 domain-containing protein [Erythrobacter sp.]
MARPPALLPDAEALRGRIGADGRLAVRVTAGAREDSVTLFDEAVLVKVRAPADKGAANEAVISVVARALGLAPSRVRLLRGAASREKLLAVEL